MIGLAPQLRGFFATLGDKIEMMKEIVEAFKRGFWLVNHFWPILLIGLLISFVPDIERMIGIRWLRDLVGLVWMLVTLGWVGTKLAWLRDGFLKKRVEWGSFATYTIKYMRRLFWVGLVYMLVLTGLVLGMFVMAGRWYVANFPERLAGLGQKEKIVRVITDLGKGELIGFFRQLQVMGWLNGVFLVLEGLIAPVMLMSIVVLVVEDVGVWQSVSQAGQFLRKHWLFYGVVAGVMLILGQVTGSLVLLQAGLAPWVSPIEGLAVMRQVSGSPWMYVIRGLGVYKNLLLSAFGLVYYVKFSKKEVGSKHDEVTVFES